MILDFLPDEQQAIFTKLQNDLIRYRPVNAGKWEYYDATAAIRNIGLAVPQSMVNVDVVLGWPEIVVDSLDERLDWQGWSSPDGDVSGLMQVFRDNQLGYEFDKAKLDCLVTGVGFLEVSAGDAQAGESAVIANAVSSMDATFMWDERRNRVAAGLVQKAADDGTVLVTLYLPDETVSVTYLDGEVDVSTSVHGRGRCGLIPVMNRKRADQTLGKSEITKSIRYYTDHGVRTLLGMEYNRELYTTPQRWFANVYAEDFGFSDDDTAAEVTARGVKAAMNRATILEPNYDEDGQAGPEPKTGQYNAAPPTPYIEQLKMLAQFCSAQSGVPANYFGFSTENPPSAEAIVALESRLVRRAMRRQSLMNQPLRNDLAYVIQSILDDSPADPAFIASLDCVWRDAGTPTRAASVDAAGKLVASEILDKDSTVLLEMVGFTPEQIERIQVERTRSVSRRLIESIRERQQGPSDALVAEGLAARVGEPAEAATEQMSTDEMNKAFDALGKAIRSGVDPKDAAARVGMTGLKFTGAIPTTLRVMESDASKLED